MERLIHRINLTVSKGDWKPIKVGRKCPKLSHFFFADDIILFVEASLSQVKVIRQVFNDFCEWSSQRVNLNKSIVYVSSNVKP